MFQLGMILGLFFLFSLFFIYRRLSDETKEGVIFTRKKEAFIICFCLWLTSCGSFKIDSFLEKRKKERTIREYAEKESKITPEEKAKMDAANLEERREQEERAKEKQAKKAQESKNNISQNSDTEVSEEQKLNAIKEEIKKYFSSWDGSNLALTKFIKKNMNDPKSYKHVETSISILADGKNIFVIQSFRGKNAYGGVVLNRCKAKQNIKTGELTEIDCGE